MKRLFKKALSFTLAAAMSLTLLSPAAFAAPALDVSQSSANDNLLRIWYDEPATDWETEALAIGNGYMGGMVFGGVKNDRVHINEKTVWNGGPTATNNNYNYGNTNPTETEEDLQKIKADLNAIREKLDDKSEFVFGFDEDSYQSSGTSTQGEAMNWLNKLMGNLTGYDAPQDFADLNITNNGIDEGAVTNYIRDLDMRTGLATVSFDYDGVHYTREYFNSYPDNVLVVRLTADKAGKININTKLSDKTWGNVFNTAEGDTITMRSRLGNGLNTEAQLKVLPEGGNMSVNGSSIDVANADGVTLVLACGTDYKMELPTFRGEDPHEAITGRISTAADKGYAALKEDHVADHSALFSRMELGFNEEIPQIPTDELIKKYRNMVDKKDGEVPTTAEQRALEVICYQFGRYLTIAGSREGSLPTNLQGVWGEGGFAWGGDYHFNINVQMNYWPTMASNLAECHVPYNDYLNVLRQAGRGAAASAFGIKSEEGEENGWLVGCFSTPYMFATMGQKNNAAGWNPTGSAWALLNSYEYYLFSKDTDYLKNELYPSMKEVANFWNEALFWSETQQRYVSGPSYSPENGPIVNGASYDQQFIWQHFENTIQAAEILGVDEDLVATWREKQSKLDPVIVGDSGQVKEWYEETTFGKAKAGDLDEIAIPQWRQSLGAGTSGQEPPHRHLSHLMALYPGNMINKDNAEYMDAAMVSLNERGLDATGWSKAHKLNLWARTGSSDEAFQIVQSAVGGGNSGFLTNLFSSHGSGLNYKQNPIFQIDGNFGYTAGVNEMLLQSQLGYVQFLPAVPEEWGTGFVEGMVARGDFEIDMNWSNNSADRFTILSRAGGTFTGEYKDLASFAVKKADGTPVETTKLSDDKISFETVKGESYVIDLNATPVKLQNQINEANEIAAQMDTELLSTAKQILTDCIAASQEIVDNEQSDKYYDQRVLLAAACSTAQDAIDLYSAITDAQTLYNTLDPNADWATLRSYTYALAVEIESAAAVLQNSEATSETYTTALAALTAAVDNIKGLDAQLTVKFTPGGGNVSAGDLITLSCPFDDLQIRYTTDGNEPFSFSNIYTGPIAVKNGGMTVKAALYNGTVQMSDVFTAVYTTAAKDNVAPTATKVVESDYYYNMSSYNGRKAVDGNPTTRWATNNGTSSATLELTFENPVTVDSAAIDQYYSSYGNDIKNFNIEYWNGEEWVAALAGGSMGTEKKEFSFDEFTADKIRLNILSGINPSIYEFELFKPVVFEEPEDTNKTILSKVIDGAAAAIESGEVDKAIQSVRESFMATYNYAVAVNENPTSDQETIDRAWVSLMTEMHKLGLIAGDKTTLQKHYDYYNALDLELYLDGAEKDNFVIALDAALKVLKDGDAMQAEIQATDSALIAAADALVKRGDKEALKNTVDGTASYSESDYAKGWDAFVEARTAANAVLENKNATQEEVNAALDKLIDAMLELRYKADKDILKKLTGEAKEIDLSAYSKASVDNFNRALADAQETAANDALSIDEQDTVNQAVANLSEAIRGLAYPDGTPAGLTVNGDGSISRTSTSAKTGDTTPVAMAVAALLLAGGAAVVLKKAKR